jgi:RES domain-containing protein
LVGKIESCTIKETAKSLQVNYTIADIHVSSVRSLSKVDAADDYSSDWVDEA